MSVVVEHVDEAPEREQAEVAGQHREVEQRADVADHRHAQRQQRERAHREGDEVEVGEVGGIELLHADVVVRAC